VTSIPDNLPEQLTLDEAFRAAFYMIRKYADLEKEPNTTLTLLLQYMWTDPARWQDWQTAVSRALTDGGLADPDHEGQWQIRPAIPMSFDS
jgi:hypothetical protein